MNCEVLEQAGFFERADVFVGQAAAAFGLGRVLERDGSQPARPLDQVRILERAVQLKPTGHHLRECRSTRERSMFQSGG